MGQQLHFLGEPSETEMNEIFKDKTFAWFNSIVGVRRPQPPPQNLTLSNAPQPTAKPVVLSGMFGPCFQWNRTF